MAGDELFDCVAFPGEVPLEAALQKGYSAFNTLVLLLAI